MKKTLDFNMQTKSWLHPLLFRDGECISMPILRSIQFVANTNSCSGVTPDKFELRYFCTSHTIDMGSPKIGPLSS